MHPHRPRIDADSLHAALDAIETLALLRGIHCPIADPDVAHDPADALHLAWSLSLQIDALLPDLITHARDHGHSWTHIRSCLQPDATPTR